MLVPVESTVNTNLPQSVDETQSPPAGVRLAGAVVVGVGGIGVDVGVDVDVGTGVGVGAG